MDDTALTANMILDVLRARRCLYMKGCQALSAAMAMYQAEHRQPSLRDGGKQKNGMTHKMKKSKYK